MQILAEPLSIPGDVFDEREIPSDTALITPLVVRLIERLSAEKLIDEQEKSKIELCLDEAITNAVHHGNKGDFSKSVKVSLWRDADAWGVVIEDEGDGFTIKDTSRKGGGEDLWQESGRGLALLTLYMDEVIYYNGGRTLLLRHER